MKKKRTYRDMWGDNTPTDNPGINKEVTEKWERARERGVHLPWEDNIIELNNEDTDDESPD